MINRLTGTEMWVTDERLSHYLAAGHKLAAEAASPEELKEPKEEEVKVEIKKKAKKETAEQADEPQRPIRRRRRRELG